MNGMIKKGILIADKRGTYIIADIEDRYIAIRDVIMDRRGAFHYGKRRIIGVKDIDNYTLV